MFVEYRDRAWKEYRLVYDRSLLGAQALTLVLDRIWLRAAAIREGGNSVLLVKLCHQVLFLVDHLMMWLA
jgi:hypothetical protein